MGDPTAANALAASPAARAQLRHEDPAALQDKIKDSMTVLGVETAPKGGRAFAPNEKQRLKSSTDTMRVLGFLPLPHRVRS